MGHSPETLALVYEYALDNDPEEILHVHLTG